jgi:threonine/homoserine/homoserine lactone efflux protein
VSPDVIALLTIASAIGVGAVSPGPSFVMVMQTSLSTSARNGRFAALGIGAGGLIFAVAATAGLGAVIVYAGPAFLAVKVAGGIYLMYLALRIWRASAHQHSEEDAEPAPSGRTFVTGLLTQLSNPKAIVVYASVFASALPRQPSPWLLIALPLAVWCIETGWYLIVASVMSRPALRRVYARATKHLDRLAAIIMGGLGAVFTSEGIRAAIR